MERTGNSGNNTRSLHDTLPRYISPTTATKGVVKIQGEINLSRVSKTRRIPKCIYRRGKNVVKKIVLFRMID